MPFIETNNNDVGIRGLMNFRPQTGLRLQQLAQALLVEESQLSRFEREIIASYVSNLNACEFCCNSHTAIAEALDPQNAGIVRLIQEDLQTAPINSKLKSLLKIAALVQKSGRHVSPGEIQEAKKAGATDQEIHDTVLIAAAFCMFNRYVDGLRATLPDQVEAYAGMGKMIAQMGYVR